MFSPYYGQKPITLAYAGKSQVRKFTAAIAIPTPKSTPARMRFEPPSPNANVSPPTTIATSDSPRAIVLVNASCKTLTAFSQGEFPCAKAGAARNNPATTMHAWRETSFSRIAFRQIVLMLESSFALDRGARLVGRVLACSFGRQWSAKPKGGKTAVLA